MSRHEKLLERLRRKPNDFAWAELKRLLGGFGYKEESGEGSRRRFIHSETKVMISLHEPHPEGILKSYQVRDILAHLKQEGYL